MIYLQETQDRESFAKKVLTAEVERDIGRLKRVLIKPNMVSYEPYPTTTHPALLKACIEYFVGHKKEIVVADGPAPDAGDSQRIMQNHDLKAVCDELGVPLINLIQGEMKKMERGDFDLELSTIPFEYDFLLSLPVLKSHFSCKFTGALKNQLGFTSAAERLNLHFFKDIHRGIVELNRIIKPNFYIVDAVETLINANEVRHGGRKKILGFMLAGADPVGLDAAGLELLKRVEPKLEGKSCEDIPYLKYAIDLGLGSPYHEIKPL